MASYLSMTLNVEVISPTAILFSGQAQEVVAPSVQGEVGVLAEHAGYLTSLQKGSLKLVGSQDNQSFEIESGLLTVSEDKVTVLVDALASGES